MKGFMRLSACLTPRVLEIPMKGPYAFQGKFGKRIFSNLPIMRFHRSKQSALIKSLNG